MITKLTKLMNKKGQYYTQQPREKYAHLHPILIIGLAVILLHFLFPVMGMSSHSFVFGAGLIITLIGGVLSAMNSV